MRILIVDGYNVIRSTPPYRHMAEKDLDSARVALVSENILRLECNIVKAVTSFFIKWLLRYLFQHHPNWWVSRYNSQLC